MKRITEYSIVNMTSCTNFEEAYQQLVKSLTYRDRVCYHSGIAGTLPPFIAQAAHKLYREYGMFLVQIKLELIKDSPYNYNVNRYDYLILRK